MRPHQRDQANETVGIASIGCYIPAGILTSAEISKRSGIPLHVFIENLGMDQKHIAADNEHPSDMGIKAASSAIKKAGIKAEDIGIVAYCGLSPYDYRLWSPAARISAAIGINNSYAFEIRNGCNGGNVGLNICKNLLLDNENKEYALLICSEKLSATVDHNDPNSHSLFLFADGAVAAVLKKGEPSNRILSYSSITDGSLVDFLKIPLGGTKIPYSPFCDSRLGCICLEDPAGVDRILSQMYIPNYQKVISEAVKKSGHRLEDIDILFTNQVKKSALENIIQSVGLGEDKTMLSIKEYGHMGTVDGLFNLSRALEQGKLGPGDFAVLASSGAGFTWAAMALEFY